MYSRRLNYEAHFAHRSINTLNVMRSIARSRPSVSDENVITQTLQGRSEAMSATVKNAVITPRQQIHAYQQLIHKRRLAMPSRLVFTSRPSTTCIHVSPYNSHTHTQTHTHTQVSFNRPCPLDDSRPRRFHRRIGKERMYLYSAFIVATTLKALRRGSHSFTCK